MRIATIEAIPVRITRDLDAATGTAGSPSLLRADQADYRWSDTVTALYSIHFETALVKLVLDNGLVGWGEAQAPLAPQVTCAIIDCLLKPVVLAAGFDATPEGIARLWQLMYDTMRVRGHRGSFMLDAISGVDLALWDLAGKLRGLPVSAIIAGAQAKSLVPAYVSGLPAGALECRVQQARDLWESGFRDFKLYYDSDDAGLFRLIDRLREEFGLPAGIAVDALWRLDETAAVPFGRALDERGALWLECPLMPEDPGAHGRLGAAIKTPLAIGESYRTCYELAAFLETGVIRYVQPDLGRTGITEGLRIARFAASRDIAVAPHVSIALGPQLAAAVHYAAAVPNARLLEYNPSVFRMANRFLEERLLVHQAAYVVPQGPGLCANVLEAELRQVNQFAT